MNRDLATIQALDLAGVACSVGSACSSGSTELSPTLRAMDLPNAVAASSLRFSLGATTTAAEKAQSSVGSGVGSANPFEVNVNPYQGYKNPFQ